MLFYDALDGGESNAGAFKFVVLVKALEWREEPGG